MALILTFVTSSLQKLESFLMPSIQHPLRSPPLVTGRALTLKPTTIAGALASILELGEALGEAENARRCVDALEERLAAVSSRVISKNRARVLGLER